MEQTMVWIDDELVFSRLNTLMTVAKDATDRVIEATSRAQANPINGLKSITNESHITHPEPGTPTDIVQQPDYPGRPKPLTTEGGRLVSARRVLKGGENPQSITEEATQQ